MMTTGTLSSFNISSINQLHHNILQMRGFIHLKAVNPTSLITVLNAQILLTGTSVSFRTSWGSLLT